MVQRVVNDRRRKMTPVRANGLGSGRNNAELFRLEKHDHVAYTDLRRLRALPLEVVTLPFRRLSGLRLQWDKTKPLERVKFLSNFTSLKPIYKNP